MGDTYLDITGIGNDFAFSAGYRCRDINISGVGMREKYFVGKQTAGNFTCGSFHVFPLSIALARSVFLPRVCHCKEMRTVVR